MNSKYLKSIVVLASICLILAALLGLVNMITAPEIQAQEERKVKEALSEVLSGADKYTKLDLAQYQGQLEIPDSVVEIYSADIGGYVFKLSVKGYSTGLVLMIGVGGDGAVSGAKVISSGETNGAENGYGSSFIGKTESTVGSVATVTGSTLTTTAYKNAVSTALSLAKSLDGAKEGGNG